MAFELKTQEGVVSRIQKVTIDRINKAGGFAKVVRSLEDMKQWL
jgi:hypothetical protein